MIKCVFHKQCQLYSVSLYEKFILSFSRPVFCWNLTWQNLDGLAKLANLTVLPELVIYCFELKTFITLIFNWFLLLWWVLCLKWSLKTAHLRNWLLLNKITLKKWMLKRNMVILNDITVIFVHCFPSEHQVMSHIVPAWCC